MMRQFAIPRRGAILTGVVVALFLLPAWSPPTPSSRHRPRRTARPGGHARRDLRHLLEAMDPRAARSSSSGRRGTELAKAASTRTTTSGWSIDDVRSSRRHYTVKSTTKSADDSDIDRKEWSFTVAAPTPARPRPRHRRRRRRPRRRDARAPSPVGELEPAVRVRVRRPTPARPGGSTRQRERRPAADHRRASSSSPSFSATCTAAAELDHSTEPPMIREAPPGARLHRGSAARRRPGPHPCRGRRRRSWATR